MTTENSTTQEQKYNPQAIEREAQAQWAASNAYVAIENDPRYPKGKFYACSMLPYPSGKLHMGHVRNYTINDMMARQLRMKGYNVLMPMGWDAFGLPAENAALKNGVAPAKWTYENIAYMKQQCQAMGWAIDWSREFATCDPEYYKWNQWLFLKMLEKGVAYRKTQVVNWDPVDMTVLANEQVIDGRGWRTGALVEKREIPGYYLAITKYADELLDQVVNKLDGWPASVRAMQENWIGKSEGVRFAFTHEIRETEAHTSPSPHAGEGRGEGAASKGKLVQDGKLWVFTTRADTIMGVTFCAVAPEHPLATVAAARDAKVAAFIDEAKRGSVMEADMATMDKQGVRTGLQVTHPLTGEKVDVWVGNYVLMTYGDGAVMGVPAHDERDFAFAKKYGLPIKPVIELSKPYSPEAWQTWYGDQGKCVNSAAMNGMDYSQATNYVAQQTAAHGGEKKTQYRLRDWGISRQRYWGTPIPIIHCDGDGPSSPGCGVVPVPEKDLPVLLPQDLVPDGTGNPLNKCESFLNVACPKCCKPAKRETDTMDTFVDSSWYFMRYTMNRQQQSSNTSMISKEHDYWMPMDQYIGGITHAVLHLLYARFWTKVMRDMGMVKADEPFTNLLCQGMVLNHSYSRRTDKGGIEYFSPADVEAVNDAQGKPLSYRLKTDHTPVEYGGVSVMSKSKLNGVDPQQMIDTYGADAARLFVMFASPPEQTIEWSESGVEGAQRFLRRVWMFAEKHKNAITQTMQAGCGQQVNYTSAGKALRFEMYSNFKQAQFDYERLQYNTVVSAAMKMLNTLESAALSDSYDDRAVLTECTSLLLCVLYPVCPHLTYTLWQSLGFEAAMGSIINAPWPQVDEAALVKDEIELMLQINGKLRGSIIVPASADKAAIETAALSNEAFTKLGTPAKKVIVVPGRLVNIVA